MSATGMKLPLRQSPQICYFCAHLFFNKKEVHASEMTNTNTQSEHITPPHGNVFFELGFRPEQAGKLKAKSQRIIEWQLLQSAKDEHAY